MDHTLDFLELIRRCAVELPDDVTAALEKAKTMEATDSNAHNIITGLLENVRLAVANDVMVCQDTGTPIFWVYHSRNASQSELRSQLTDAIRKATELSYLRPNAVDSLTGKNTGNNVGNGLPVFHFIEWNPDPTYKDTMEVKDADDAKHNLRVELLLRGGGSENSSCQYSLPDSSLGAIRDLDGVRKAVLDSVYQAQGKGCAPGILGVCIGGDRDSGFLAAKHALMRRLDTTNPEPRLDAMENALMNELNQLGIGPLGLGGNSTALAVNLTTLHRLPASYFVTIAYNCWALRRKTLTINGGVATFD